MPKKYSHLFRKRIVEFYKNNTITLTLRIFKISNGSLFNWIKNNPDDNVIHKRKRKITPPMICYIKVYILKRINFNYKFLLKNIKRNFGITISKTTLYNQIKKLNITRKVVRKKFVYKKSNEHKKQIIEFTKNIKLINKYDIISIDECHFDNTLYNKYGWSEKGKKIYIKEYIRKNTRYSLLLAISNNKVINYSILQKSVNGEDFLKFIKLLNSKVSNKVILMDNARIHHYNKVKDEIKNSTNTVIYNVPYMPEYNPIEKCFSVIKNNVNNNTKNEILKNKIIKEIKNLKSSYLKSIYNNTFKDL